MKTLGFSALAATVISFLLWLIDWSYWTYNSFLEYNATRYEEQKVIRRVMQGISAGSVLTQYLAILLIAICLIMIAKRLPRS